jgi:hypothetical protein
LSLGLIGEKKKYRQKANEREIENAQEKLEEN